MLKFLFLVLASASGRRSRRVNRSDGRELRFAAVPQSALVAVPPRDRTSCASGSFSGH